MFLEAGMRYRGERDLQGQVGAERGRNQLGDGPWRLGFEEC